jgi:hypothetical protein
MAATVFTPADLLKRLPAGLQNLHLTFVTPEGDATFASDNANRGSFEGRLNTLFATKAGPLPLKALFA